MDFKHYHTSTEVEMWMKKWAEQYPDLVELYPVGKSFAGRTLWQLTITNKKTGKDTDKPAAYFEGGRHSGEITGTESSLYLAWYVLDQLRQGRRGDAAARQEGALRPAAQQSRRLRALPPHGADQPQQRPSARQRSATACSTRTRPRISMATGSSGRCARRWRWARASSFSIPTTRAAGCSSAWARARATGSNGARASTTTSTAGYNEDGIGGLDLHRNYLENWRPEPGEERRAAARPRSAPASIRCRSRRPARW